MSFAKSIILILIIIDASHCFAQQHCSYTLVSPIYDYYIDSVRNDQYHGTATLTIKTKADHQVKQTIVYDWAHVRFDCSCLSYITGYNIPAPNSKFSKIRLLDVDLLIADFNFDGKEDVAVKASVKGNQELYRYYFQDDTGAFIEQPYFPARKFHDIANTLPFKIDTANKELTFYEELMKGEFTYATFHYDVHTKKWNKTLVETGDGKALMHYY